MKNLQEYKKFSHRRRLNKTKEELNFYPALHPLRNEFKIKIKNEYPIRPYVIDFYIPKLGIAIEIDGGYHKERIEYDSKRDSFLTERDIVVLRFDNGMVINNLDWVLGAIRKTILKRLDYNFDNRSACKSNASEDTQ